MKLLIFIGLVAMAQALSDTTITASKFCNNKACTRGPSVACLFISSTDMWCNGNIIPLNQSLILSMHNRFRENIASGALRLPQAAKMSEMKWSDDLAQLALYNVKRCEFSHDACRSTPEFPYAGQNVALFKTTSNRIDFTLETKNAIADWFMEYGNCDCDIKSFIYKYHYSSKWIGHFTQTAKDSSNYIGCAAVNFKSDWWNKFILVCNYAKTNIIGQATYVVGNTGSQCNRKSSRYPSLCSS